MSNKRKDELLGMPHGTANGKLTKMILFDLAGRLNLLNCFRCGKQIETLRDLSVEHKEAWMSAPDPKASYFDLNNIAYSHLRCNCLASNKTNAALGWPGARRANVTNKQNGHPWLKKQELAGWPNLRNNWAKTSLPDKQ